MMKEFIITDYKPILTKCFSEDRELLSKWHIKSGLGLGACVDHTFNHMAKINIEFHVVYRGQELMGYFGKEIAHNAIFLTGFFLMPKHRNKENIIEFWGLIKNCLGLKFFCGLYEKNQPAIDFILKQKAEQMATLNHDGHRGVFYRIEERPCQ